MTRAVAIEWAARGRPIPGEAESGDEAVAGFFPGGALLGVIDGLGHGKEAAAASRIAAAVLDEAPQRPVLDLIHACHRALRGSRGAVMSLASIDCHSARMAWAGVGNVEAVLTRADPARKPLREHILLRGGVVGYQLPPLRFAELELFAGDVLVVASDGLEAHFDEGVSLSASPAENAEGILRAYGRSTDDATVLVARFGGAAP